MNRNEKSLDLAQKKKNSKNHNISYTPLYQRNILSFNEQSPPAKKKRNTFL